MIVLARACVWCDSLFFEQELLYIATNKSSPLLLCTSKVEIIGTSGLRENVLTHALHTQGV